MSAYFGKNLLEWTDMSDFVVHFTREYGGKSAYDNMLSILANKVIKAKNSFGMAKSIAPDHDSQMTVCFSEVPLHRLIRLAKARSDYGIVFRKDSVIHRKGNPILYAYKDHPALTALRKLAKSAAKEPKILFGRSHLLWTRQAYTPVEITFLNGSASGAK